MSEKKAKVVKPEVQAKFGPSLLVFLLVTAVILYFLSGVHDNWND